MEELVGFGLQGIEAYHSDHSADDTHHYLAYAARYHLAVTGGSDFHGDAKPSVALGTGRNHNLDIPIEVLENLRDTGRGAGHD
jgi:hypothetical protein